MGTLFLCKSLIDWSESGLSYPELTLNEYSDTSRRLEKKIAEIDRYWDLRSKRMNDRPSFGVYCPFLESSNASIALSALHRLCLFGKTKGLQEEFPATVAGVEIADDILGAIGVGCLSHRWGKDAVAKGIDPLKLPGTVEN